MTNLIKLTNKAHNVIASCKDCNQLVAAEQYIENFKQLTDNNELYNKLLTKINEKKQEFNCDFRI